MKTTLRTIATAAMVLTFYLSGISQQVSKSIPNSTSPDGIIGFLQFTPSDYGSQKHPLIIFLHGIGERGNGTPSQLSWMTDNAIPKFCAAGASMRFTVNGQTSSFVVLSPQLSTQYGYWPTFYVTEMIKYAKANLTIDTNRIYLCGLSLGGGGVWRALTETNVQNGDYTFDAGIAAATPVCGTQEENDGYFCNTIGANHVPIWAFHSMDDGTVPVQATEHAQILAANCGVTPAPLFTYYQSGGHAGAWINAYDTGHITVPTVVNGNVVNFTQSPNLFEWLLSNKRGTTTTPANTAPVANAGTAQTITLPASTVSLTGTGTGTNGATISSYSWSKTSGPSAGNIVSSTAASTSVTGMVQGTYVFTLTVTDNHGLSNSSGVTITVNAAATANTAPIANAGTAQTITLPLNTVALSGSGSGTNGATIVSYSWVKTSGPTAGVFTSNTAVATSATGLGQGTYVFTLTVTDNHGLTNSSSVTVTVNAATAVNQTPTSNAGANQAITLPTNTVTLNGAASFDPDGSITGYVWTQTSGPVGPVITNRNAGTTTVTGLLAGTYTFVLQVTDNGGLSAYSAMTLTVNGTLTAAAAANKPPSSNAGANQTITLPANTVTLDGSASKDPDGSIVSYIWTQTSGPVGPVITNRFAATTTITGLVAGSYTFDLEVTDNGGLSTYSNMALTVNNAATSTGGLLGYIKMSVGPYQACDDASSLNRTAVYGTSIANGSVLYTDAAKTQIFNGGWNWFSFTPTLGGTTTYAFAVYPAGAILLLRNCATGAYARVADSSAFTNADEDIAALQHMKDSAETSEALIAKGNKVMMYPNPVHTTATIELNSAADGNKVISIYNESGVLKAKYIWQTYKGYNTFSLKNVTGLANGLYIVDIRDTYGKPIGSLKFIKM